MSQWYAVQVWTGREEETARVCRKLLSADVLEESFVPLCERMRRYEGSWHREQKPAFPGYLFLIAKDPEALFVSLKRVPMLTKLLGDGADAIAIRPEEAVLIERMCGRKRVAQMSVGYIEGDRVVITSGPLQRIEGKIRKIDRHKRVAVVEVEMFGRKQDVTMGVEIVRKVGERR